MALILLQLGILRHLLKQNLGFFFHNFLAVFPLALDLLSELGVDQGEENEVVSDEDEEAEVPKRLCELGSQQQDEQKLQEIFKILSNFPSKRPWQSALSP